MRDPGSSGVSAATGCELHYADGTRVVDYLMDGGLHLAGYSPPAVVRAVESVPAGSARDGEPPGAGAIGFGWPCRTYADADVALAAAEKHVGTAACEPFDSELVDAGIFESEVVDMRRGWGRVDPGHAWRLVVLGASAAAGHDFGAVLARDATDLPEAGAPTSPKALAAAAAVNDLAGGVAVAQTSGRAERLAYGLAELAQASGVRVRPVQPGGMFRLVFDDSREAERFAAEMFARGIRVPADGIWWPSFAHDYFTIESTVDAAAAAFVATCE